MAIADTRTWTDDVSDALTQLDVVQRELTNWRAHLEALQTNPAPGHALMAARVKNVAVNAVLDAAGHTAAAYNRLPVADVA